MEQFPFSKSRGVTQKCDGCYDLRRAGKDPVCVAICRTSALQFSQTGEVNQDMVSDIPALACSSLTKPSLKIRLSEMLLGETAKTITEEAIHSREEQTQKETPFIRDTDKTFIILGTGVASLCAAEAIRERNRTCRIIMIGKEKIPPYSRPMLSKTNIRTYDASYTLLKPESWYQQEGIELLTDTVVLSLNTATKTVHCDKADFSYDKCIYALGAKNFIPPIPGRDKQNVFSVRTYEDIDKIKRAMPAASTAVIIGAGFIGLEFALELQKTGINTTVLETLPMLMPRLLDEQTAKAVQSSLNAINIHTGVKISEIAGQECVRSVLLSDGRDFPADMLVIAFGVRANVAIAKEAGIHTEQAIVVNERMQTSAESVYACGDCAQHKGVNYALWSQSVEQGRTAGANAAGEDVVCPEIDSSLIFNSEKFGLFALGDLGKNPDTSYTCSKEEIDVDKRFFVNPQAGMSVEMKYYANGKLSGVSLVGNLSGMAELKELMSAEKGDSDE